MEQTHKEERKDNAEEDLRKYKFKKCNVTEIKSLANPPVAVSDVLSSTLLVLGHTEREAKKWDFIKKQLAKSGKENLVSRCNDCRPENVSVESATLAKNILDEYTVATVKSKSFSTVPFYAWTKLMVDEVLNAQNKG